MALVRRNGASTYCLPHTECRRPGTLIYYPSHRVSRARRPHSTFPLKTESPGARCPNLLSLSYSLPGQALQPTLPLIQSPGPAPQSTLPLIQSPGPGTPIYFPSLTDSPRPGASTYSHSNIESPRPGALTYSPSHTELNGAKCPNLLSQTSTGRVPQPTRPLTLSPQGHGPQPTLLEV